MHVFYVSRKTFVKNKGKLKEKLTNLYWHKRQRTSWMLSHLQSIMSPWEGGGRWLLQKAPRGNLQTICQFSNGSIQEADQESHRWCPCAFPTFLEVLVKRHQDLMAPKTSFLVSLIGKFCQEPHPTPEPQHWGPETMLALLSHLCDFQRSKEYLKVMAKYNLIGFKTDFFVPGYLLKLEGSMVLTCWTNGIVLQKRRLK